MYAFILLLLLSLSREHSELYKNLDGIFAFSILCVVDLQCMHRLSQCTILSVQAIQAPLLSASNHPTFITLVIDQ